MFVSVGVPLVHSRGDGQKPSIFKVPNGCGSGLRKLQESLEREFPTTSQHVIELLLPFWQFWNIDWSREGAHEKLFPPSGLLAPHSFG